MGVMRKIVLKELFCLSFKCLSNFQLIYTSKTELELKRKLNLTADPTLNSCIAICIEEVLVDNFTTCITSDKKTFKRKNQ